MKENYYENLEIINMISEKRSAEAIESLRNEVSEIEAEREVDREIHKWNAATAFGAGILFGMFLAYCVMRYVLF